MTATIGVRLTGNGEALVRAMGGSLRTVTQQAREAARDIAGSTAGAIEMGFADGLRGVEREFRASITSLEQLSRSASITNGVVNFDRSGQDAALASARENLAVQRQLAAALNIVAAAEGENSNAARIQAAATASAVKEAEQHVRALERQAALLDLVQAEIGQTAVKQGAMNRMSGEARAGLQQLTFNLNDVAVGLGSNLPLMQIFVQQGTQIIQSVQMMTNRTTGLLGILSGPYGMIFTAAIALAGGLAYGLMQAGDEAEKGKTKFLDLADATARQKAAAEELRKAIDDYNQSQEKQNDSTRYSISLALEAAQADLKRALAKRELLAAQLREQEDADEYRARTQGGYIDTSLTQGTARKVKENQADISRLQIEINNRTIELGKIASKTVDPLEAVKRKYEDIAAAAERAGRASGNGTAYGAPIADVLVEIEKRRKAEENVVREQARGTSSSSIAAAATRDARVGDMVALIKQLFPTARITSTTGGRHTKGSDHYAGRAIDFVVPGMMNAAGTEEIRRRLKDAGVDIRRNANGVEQFFGPGRSASKPGDHDDHNHLAWKGSPDPERSMAAQQRAAEEAARAAEQLARQIAEASERSVALRGQFEPLPADIVRANNALIDIEQEIAKNQALLKKDGLGADQAKELQAAIEDLQRTRDTLVPASLTQPITDELDAMREAVDAQQLLIDGRRRDYDTMQDTVDLARILGATSVAQLGTVIKQRGVTRAQLEDYYRQREVLRQQTIELQRQQQEQAKLLRVVDDVEATTKRAIYDFYDGKGLGAAKNFFKSVFDIQKQIMTEEAFKVLFGDAFEDQKLKILGLDKVKEANLAYVDAVKSTTDPLIALGNAAAYAAEKWGGGPANDNGPASPAGGFASIGIGLARGVGLSPEAVDQLGDIVVTGQKTQQQVFSDVLKKFLGEDLSVKLQDAMRGAAQGQAASGVLRSFGVKQSNTGAAIGGALGNFIPGLPPGVGSAIGGLIGGTIGGMLKKTPKGAATITSMTEDAVYSGSGKLRDSLMSLSSGVQGSLARIADALGVDVGDFRVSIGERKGYYRVSASGSSAVGDKKYPKRAGSDLLYDGKDAQAAEMAALRNAIADGALIGLSAAAQRLLERNKDIDTGLQKALLVESIPKLLKAKTNPVAAALDELNDKWERTVAALKEGAATAEQFADAEKLYQVERDEIMKAANDNLRDFINGLNFGPNSGLSLRDQSANARAQLQPYLTKIASGDIAGIDRDKYLAAAEAYREIIRAMEGSGSGYYAVVDELRQASQSLVDQSEAGAASAKERDPFAERTASATQAAANILDDHTRLLIEQNELLRAMAQGGGFDLGFIGTGRGFTGTRAA